MATVVTTRLRVESQEGLNVLLAQQQARCLIMDETDFNEKIIFELDSGFVQFPQTENYREQCLVRILFLILLHDN